jgi:hypothetical protein
MVGFISPKWIIDLLPLLNLDHCCKYAKTKKPGRKRWIDFFRKQTKSNLKTLYSLLYKFSAAR